MRSQAFSRIPVDFHPGGVQTTVRFSEGNTMATRIYIARERGLGEDSNIPDYSADDYVSALREGSTFGNDIYDLRGNILRLADYVKKYDTLRDGVLYLKNRLVVISYPSEV
jgi:hypothetical protein